MPKSDPTPAALAALEDAARCVIATHAALIADPAHHGFVSVKRLNERDRLRNKARDATQRFAELATPDVILALLSAARSLGQCPSCGHDPHPPLRCPDCAADTTCRQPILAAARRGAGETEREKALRWKLTCAQTALSNWGRHFSYCATWDEEPQLCDCGYAKAIRDADPDSFMSKEWCLAAADDEARAHPEEPQHG